jgi:hypothetical protein
MAGAAPDANLPETVQEVARSPGAGEPLPPAVKRTLEQRFHFPLSAVRVHSDAKAQAAVSRLGARAFTYGTHVFLGVREQPTDLTLMAHEVAHVIQQQGAPVVQMRNEQAAGDRFEREAEHAATAVQQGRRVAVQGRTNGPRVQGLGIRDALDFFANAANNIPGFAMLTLIIGLNPINMRPVERNATNVFRAVIGFLPGGELMFQALQRHGIIDRVGAWVQQQLSSLGMAASAFREALDRFLDSLGWRDIFDLGGVWERAKRIFTEPIGRIISFVRGLVGDMLKFIRDAILRPVARLAEGTRGYDLLKLVLGQDPITGDPYPRTAENMIGGFMRLIGQEEKWRHLQQSRAIPRAWAWFQQQLGMLLGFVREIPQLFIRLWQALQISDLLDIGGAFNKVRSIFGGFVSSFISWAGNAALQIMMFIFEVLAPGAMPVLRRAAAVFRTIISDPIRFVGNLVRAGLQGFRQFSAHIRTHLINGLVGWLTGALTGAGLQLPQRWDLRGILSLVLQILGLTWQNIRQKLLRHIPEPVVRGLETTFDIVVTLVREGPAAAWQKILEQLQNLQEMVFGGIRDWVARTVVTQAVIRIVSMLNPAGAVIQAIIAIYNTIMFFRERLQQIIQVAEAFFNSIAQIAGGAIGAAATYVEQTMGRLVPVVISFLARLIGLGGIADTIRTLITRIRAPIDRALDRVVEWIVTQARRLGSVIMRGVRGVVEQGRGGPSEQAAPAAPGDLRDRAGQMVVERSGGEHSEEEIQRAVLQVREELRSQGLQRLEFSTPTEEGESALIAQASAPKTVAKKKKPTIRKVSVVMRARLVFDKDALQAIAEGRQRRGETPLVFHQQQIPAARSGPVPGVTPGVQEAATIGAPPQRDQYRYGTVLLRPSPGSVEAQVISWSSGFPVQGSNASHAERYFDEWFSRAGLRSLKEIHVDINLSPCSICVGTLPGFKGTTVQAFLTYQIAYEGRDRRGILFDNTTTVEDLGFLRGKGWSITGPAPKWTNASKERERRAGHAILERAY